MNSFPKTLVSIALGFGATAGIAQAYPVVIRNSSTLDDQANILIQRVEALYSACAACSPIGASRVIDSPIPEH